MIWNISLQWPMLQYKTVHLLSKRVICPQIPKSPPLKLMRMWFPSLLLGPAALNMPSKSLSWIHVWLIHPIQIQCSPTHTPLCHNAGNLRVTLQQLRLCKQVTHKKSMQLTAKLPHCYFSLNLLELSQSSSFQSLSIFIFSVFFAILWWVLN